MEKPEITHLYKYRGVDAYSLSALINQTGWFAKPSSFNDPFDCAISISEERLEESVQAALDVALERAGMSRKDLPPEKLNVKPEDRQAFNLCRQLLLNDFQGIGVFCLSEIYSDILMWSHYADCHRGFCVEYERTPQNALGRLAQPVRYQAQYPSLAFHDIVSSANDTPTDILWLTKSEHWSYEREWRILQVQGDKNYQLDFAITSIIFGMRMSESNKYTIRNLLRDRPGINFKQAQKSETHFRIDVIDLEKDKAT